MKKAFAIIVLLFGSFFCIAQINLVPNPSFEDTLSCPDNQDQVYKTPPWFDPTGNTSDYYNQCFSNTWAGMDVPQNWQGYQLANTGVAYCGLATAGYFFSPDNRREYIETRLSDSLAFGKKYCIEFYVSLADSSIWAIDYIGAYLSTDSIYDYTTLDTLPYIPQIENKALNIITNKNNWTKISGEFIAGGGEKFITIGNFRGAAMTNADTLSGTWYNAYYYIDDVSVYLCDSAPVIDSAFYVPNAFSPNGDAENDIFFVQGSLDELYCEIFNLWGERVAELTTPDQGWDGKYKDMDCNTGVYIYYLKARNKKGEEIISKGNISLLR